MISATPTGSPLTGSSSHLSDAIQDLSHPSYSDESGLESELNNLSISSDTESPLLGRRKVNYEQSRFTAEQLMGISQLEDVVKASLQKERTFNAVLDVARVAFSFIATEIPARQDLAMKLLEIVHQHESVSEKALDFDLHLFELIRANDVVKKFIIRFIATDFQTRIKNCDRSLNLFRENEFFIKLFRVVQNGYFAEANIFRLIDKLLKIPTDDEKEAKASKKNEKKANGKEEKKAERRPSKTHDFINRTNVAKAKLVAIGINRLGFMKYDAVRKDKSEIHLPFGLSQDMMSIYRAMHDAFLANPSLKEDIEKRGVQRFYPVNMMFLRSIVPYITSTIDCTALEPKKGGLLGQLGFTSKPEAKVGMILMKSAQYRDGDHKKEKTEESNQAKGTQDPYNEQVRNRIKDISRELERIFKTERCDVA